MEGIINVYHSSLIFNIVEQKNYNRQHEKGDLGIKIASSGNNDPVGNVVANEAIMEYLNE